MGQVPKLDQNLANYGHVLEEFWQPLVLDVVLDVTWDKHPISAKSMGSVMRDGQSFRNGTVFIFATLNLNIGLSTLSGAHGWQEECLLLLEEMHFILQMADGKLEADC